VCEGCGSPYAANGAEESALVEIEVSAYRRVIRRPRWRRTCGCASSPAEVSAPPVPRLFARTPCGTSVWARFLFERYACLRPLHRVCAWLSDQGLPVSPGTLADSVHRFGPMFEPVGAAILAHQNGATLRHADETSWRVRALRGRDGPGYAWLWTSVGRGAVCFHVDPSRSAEAARKLFDGAMSSTVLVCDRYSGYKKLARLLGGRVTLSFCWAHMRRDFIRCAAGHVRLTGWCREWLGRIATVYRLHKARLASHDPGLERQTPAFDAAHDALAEALGGMFAAAEHQLARLSPEASEGGPLRSLLNHRQGLSVFLDRPRVPLDNNLAERLLRGPAIGRRLSFGSDSESGARFTALMYSVTGTLRLNGLDVPRWLADWLAACARGGGRPPDDLSPWLPWSMDAGRRREMTAPA
jgi:transposase